MTPRPDLTQYERIVRQFGARTYRAAQAVLRSPADAEDGVAAVFLRVLAGRLAR